MVPFGVLVVVVPELPHAGIRNSAPLMTKRASRAQAFLDRFPPMAAPKPASANIGKGIHRAKNARGGAVELVITGPKVLIVIFELADPVPFTGNVVCPAGYENVQMGGTVTRGVMVLQESVIPGLPGGVTYPLTGFTLITP